MSARLPPAWRFPSTLAFSFSANGETRSGFSQNGRLQHNLRGLPVDSATRLGGHSVFFFFFLPFTPFPGVNFRLAEVTPRPHGTRILCTSLFQTKRRRKKKFSHKWNKKERRKIATGEVQSNTNASLSRRSTERRLLNRVEFHGSRVINSRTNKQG